MAWQWLSLYNEGYDANNFICFDLYSDSGSGRVALVAVTLICPSKRAQAILKAVTTKSVHTLAI
jgi:hypothetical protein